MADEIYDTFPVCPWCEKRVNDYWETFDITNDGQAETLECEWCSETFTVRQSVSVNFLSVKSEGIS